MRADKYRVEPARRSFVVGRAALRTLLGQRLNVSPASIKFVYGPHGKPHILDEDGRDRIHFSISNTSDFIVVALSSSRVGIDIEQVLARDYSDLYAFALSGDEARFVGGLSAALRERAFLQLWTRKEALLKAMGVGLSDVLPNMDVSCDERMHNLSAVGHSGLTTHAQFRVSTIDIGDTCMAAIALQEPAAPISIYPYKIDQF
ncbi:4'-phosphopantetheinyl transferase superfamily protein [Mesorhizobium sp. M0115]|uniref:4'-phosphopantetheinyl transferase family protein n=1 Tax=unclassified Mesorhizobium TaxID=325217 RepID=UPI00333CB67D